MENPLLPRFEAILNEIRALAHEKPHVREEALQKLPQTLSLFLRDLSKNPEDPLNLTIITSLQDFLALMIESNRWEDRFSALFSLERALTENFLLNFGLNLFEKGLFLLEDKELRVRSQAAFLLGKLAEKLGFSKIFSLVFDEIYKKSSIEAEKPTGRLLESYLTSLREIMRFWDSKLNVPMEKPDFERLIQLLKQIFSHSMKHIRALALEILEKLLVSAPLSEIQENLTVFLVFLEDGLADNMTETRFQGTKTAGSFLIRLKLEGDFKNFPKESIFQRLLPRICFNRLYPAEAFSKESLRIWKELAETHGKELLGRLINESIEFYLAESKKSNWEIRETACKGFQELATKAVMNNEEAKEKFMVKSKEILRVLLKSARDQYHMVREAANMAVLNILQAENGIFDSEEAIGEIFEEALEFLGDSFHENRRNTVEILGFISEKDSVKGEIAMKVMESVGGRLKEFEEEKCHEHEKEHEKGHICNIEHEKDHICEEIEGKKHFHEHKGDLFDGLVGYFRELARIFSKNKIEILEKFWEVIMDNFRVFDKETSAYIRENVWKNINEGLVSSGKPFIKRHLDEILLKIFEEINKNKNTASGVAAKELLKRLQGFVGANILKGRAEGLENGKWVKLFSEFIK